mmetsp:Transcript_15489/g.22083  ORF Transcript_15489/g.22083 Transcript_15489/m.22083 type:complete len:797 (+) Transcript_15489:101-2491(+)
MGEKMTTVSDDDIFTSLGNSLVRDLLSDISGVDGDTDGLDENLLRNLSTLERELDISIDSGRNDASNSSRHPPGMKGNLLPGNSGLSNLSAGAIIVDHASGRKAGNGSPMTPHAVSTPKQSDQDAWALSLANFSASSLADDFLAADSARKEKLQKDKDQNTTDDALLAGAKNYDLDEDVMLGATSEKSGGLFGKESHLPVSDKSISPLPHRSGSETVPPTGPPHEADSKLDTIKSIVPNIETQFVATQFPKSFHSQNHFAPQQILPPGVPPPQISLQNVMPMVPRQHIAPHMIQPHPIMGSNVHQPPHMMPPPPIMMQHSEQNLILNQTAFGGIKQPPQRYMEQDSLKITKQETTVFKKKDFPALGEKEVSSDSEEEKNIDMEDKPVSTLKSPIKRHFFRNTAPNATPIPATSVIVSSMSSRELYTVIFAMMRPLLSFSSVLDAYNADYYRWSYEDRKSRNLLFLGGATASSTNLPKPVWKETKIKAHKMEVIFRESVEKRATDWSKDKNILGKVVKNNVKRPRALLATTTLSSSSSTNLELSNGFQTVQEHYSEEDRQRMMLWEARVAIDKGYIAYLNLVELRRLLQSSNGANFASEEFSGREELLGDVEENVRKLNLAFGVNNEEHGPEQSDTKDLIVDGKALSKSLALPKGRMLLSRVIDEGVLPHSSACCVLPKAIQIIFESSENSRRNEENTAPPPGEDRLLRSLNGLVRIVQPSVHPKNLLSCLDAVMGGNINSNEKSYDVKKILTGKRTLIELLYSIISRGKEICTANTQFYDEWNSKEMKFMSILVDE